MGDKTPPPRIQSKKWAPLPYLLAGVVLIMAVLQLVNFEAFALHIASYEIGTPNNAPTIAVSLITTEIFSLPFLLHLWLSKLARALSAFFVLLAPLLWILISIQAIARQLLIANMGVFGDTIPFVLNPVSITFLIAWLAISIVCFVVLHGRNAFKAI